jgi:3,4-dihydroxy 2-butanone 4-phosphate synthase/GTP cyclohydrolase II
VTDSQNFTSSSREVSPIEDVLEDYRRGKMVILVDDEDRENEGDLVIAAEFVSANDINFMAGQGRGLICLALTEDRCRQLNLSLMVNQNNSRYSTNFTVSIEAADGVTTGISAADRARTIQTAVRENAGAKDIVTPGHVFPIMAQPGGVLTRAGHTEAGIDLARLSGLVPASVICEILNPDGTMARLPDLVTFASTHDLRIGTIADLIRYRLGSEPTVWRVSEHAISTRYGDFRGIIYEDSELRSTHLAIVRGVIDGTAEVMVRVQSHRGVFDLLGEARGVVRWTVDQALRRLSEEEQGVLILLEYSEDAGGLERRLRGESTLGAVQEEDGHDLRMLGAGSQILANLGVRKVRVLGTPRRTHALSGYGLEVTGYVDEPGAG